MEAASVPQSAHLSLKRVPKLLCLTATSQLGLTAQAITDAGGTAIAIGCDITERSSVDAGVGRVNSELGAIDALVNNAGWDLFVPFVDTQPEDWSRLIDINLIGHFTCTMRSSPDDRQRWWSHHQRFIGCRSIGSSGEAVYAACKAGMVALSKTLAREHSRHNITFNVVCPGPTDTALTTVTDAAANPEKLREAFRRSIPIGRLENLKTLLAQSVLQ